MLRKVISGGQTGVDRLGLEVAKALNIPTGGMVPKGFRTEKGSDLSLRDFGLMETQSEGYTFRTLHNVLDSDGTVVFGDVKSPGTQQTLANAITNKKPYIANPSIEKLVAFIRENDIQTLNVAGNRGSRLTVNQYKEYGLVLTEAFKEVISVPT